MLGNWAQSATQEQSLRCNIKLPNDVSLMLHAVAIDIQFIKLAINNKA